MRNRNPKNPPKPGVIEAHSRLVRNQEALLKSHTWGCFYCCKIFPKPTDEIIWVYPFAWRKAAPEDLTALCPYCRIDSCIGDSSGFPITLEFMKDMEAYFFGY